MKWSRDEFWFWFGVWTSIPMLAGAGTVISFSDWFEPAMATKIAKACLGVAAINNVVLTAAKFRGYMDAKIAASLPDPTAMINVLIAAFLLSAILFAPPALAQGQVRPKPIDPLQKLIED